MMYIKPKDMSYSDMCIWVDEHAYEEGCDQEKLFEYLYHIALMLAKKNRYFNNNKDYEDFAIFLASRIFFRLTNPKQYQYNEAGEPKMTKLKSVLNYMRCTLYPAKVDYQQQYYAQTRIVVEDIDYVSEYSFADKLNDTVDELTAKDFEICLEDIIKTAKAFLYRIPYKKNTAEWINIYTSCLLTFLNSITIDNAVLDKMSSFKRTMLSKDNFYVNLYKKNARDSVILFHLPDSMRDYIDVLVRELKRAIASDLSFSFKTYVPSNSGMELVALSTLNGEIDVEDYQ